MADHDFHDDSQDVVRPLLTGLGVLLVVSLVVGAVVGLVALSAVRFSGLGGSSGPEAEPSLYFPESTPSSSEPAPSAASSTPVPSPSPSPAESRTPREPRPPRSVISLSASPLSAGSMERIYLTGTYPGGEGASLQVQRFEGGWTDFPTSASVSDSIFSTYVMTGQTGRNQFRVVDPGAGKISNPVTVTVR